MTPVCVLFVSGSSIFVFNPSNVAITAYSQLAKDKDPRFKFQFNMENLERTPKAGTHFIECAE